MKPIQKQDRAARDSKRGVALIMTVLAIAVCIGMLGLTFDLARLYIAKNELQTYADSASLAATVELDGTDEGIERARNVGMNFPNKWYFQSQEIPAVTVQFAENPEGPWYVYPPTPTGFRFAEAIAEGDVQLYFLPAFEALRPKGAGNNSLAFAIRSEEMRKARIGGDSAFAMLLESTFSEVHVIGRGASGQIRKKAFGEGLLPYSPFAHLSPGHVEVVNPYTGDADPFNFVVGQQYTMRYPPPGLQGQTVGRCEGDWHMESDFPYAGEAERGFIDIGIVPGSTAGTNGSAFIRQAIVSNVQSHGVEIGVPIVSVNGQRETEVDALLARIGQDSDEYSETFDDYMQDGAGNGRRLVYMPVNNPYNNKIVVEFATFFLPPANEICGNNPMSGAPKPCCAEYVGPGLLHSRSKGADDEVGVSEARLIE